MGRKIKKENCDSQTQRIFFNHPNIMGSLFKRTQQQERVVRLGSIDDSCSDNTVYTAKYTAITFIPKCILLQFLRLSNIVFLTNAILQSIRIISNLSPFTAIGPLCFVLFVSLIRQGYEDRKRHVRDSQINSRITRVLRQGVYQETQWQNVRVGDFVKVRDGEIIPADLLLLYTSEQNSMCYVQTANLDGESNLKEKFAFTEGIKKYPHQFAFLEGQCTFDSPKPNLHQFDGKVQMKDKELQYVGLDNLLLRETTLRNTEEVVGVAVYCGYDTKILQNQGQVHHKMSQIEKKLNYIQVAFLLILGVVCGTCSLGYWFIHSHHKLRDPGSYIPTYGLSIEAESGLNFLSVFILLNFLIPISLTIFIEGIKTFSGIFLAMDNKMKDEETNSSCGVLNSSILEELGVISYVLTDKTGTLTANEMVFRKIAVQDRIFDRENIIAHIDELSQYSAVNQFLESMIICHEVVKDLNKDKFEGSSPDEVCFVEYAQKIGYEFIKRTKTHIELMIRNKKKVYELVDILSFDARKRMSVAVKDVSNPDQVLVYTKGADSQILAKSHKYKYEKEIHNKINNFAREGLRTLLFAKRIIPTTQYQQFIDRRNSAKRLKIQRKMTKQIYDAELANIVEEIQSNLTIVGASGIEDRLQEDVPQTIERLQRAGIVVMMITGDKMETAENIGYLAKLIKSSFKVVRLTADTADLRSKCQELLIELETDNEVAILVEGKQISNMVQQKEPTYVEVYKKILLKARSVIFCRSSPKQKAEIVKFIRTNMGSTVLAIGDGGNDVGMIEEANIGVGIIGKEGNSAAAVSDFSFGKFKFLDRLLFHHGRWAYYRLSYFFIFYSWKNIIITFMMFYANVHSSFSGVRNFTQFFYVVFNSFFAVAQIVNSGLYDQDINDDLQPAIWKYLPEIYEQTKNRGLFSYKRFAAWTISAIMVALVSFQILITSLSPANSMDSNGRIADSTTEHIANGMTLPINMIIVNYIDTQSHNWIFEVVLFVFCSLVLSSIYYVAENYLAFLGSYLAYSDNWNMRFFLTIFVICMITLVVKLTYVTFMFQFEPTLIDIYKKHMHSNPYILDTILNSKPVDTNRRLFEQTQQLEFKKKEQQLAEKGEIEVIPVEILSQNIDGIDGMGNSQIYTSTDMVKRPSNISNTSQTSMMLLRKPLKKMSRFSDPLVITEDIE